MASYLSYFTSGSSASPAQQYQNAPPSGSASTWSNTISSRLTTLRKALTKDSEEDDPDNEDCSHVSNVLRAYYTEKGRTFPEWLPPDPTKPQVQTPQIQNQYGQYGQFGNSYGNQYGGQPADGRGIASRGGLSDLWDSAPSQPAPAVQSLRAPRPTPQSLRSHDSSGSADAGISPGASQRSAAGARPLPSQRVGSYQTTQNASSATLGSKDRLRARLQGGGNGRNSPGPPSSSGSLSYGQTSGSYDSQGSGGNPYATAAEPWSNNSGNPYGQEPSYHNTSGGNPYNVGAQRQRPSGPRS